MVDALLSPGAGGSTSFLWILESGIGVQWYEVYQIYRMEKQSCKSRVARSLVLARQLHYLLKASECMMPSCLMAGYANRLLQYARLAVESCALRYLKTVVAYPYLLSRLAGASTSSSARQRKGQRII